MNKKYTFIFLILIFFQSCVKCYSEKQYTLSKSDYYENIDILGIDDLETIGDTLTFSINTKKIPKNLSLNKIKIFYEQKYLGELVVNTDLSRESQTDVIAPDGTLIKRIPLRKEMKKVLNNKKIEKMLEIREDYMSKDVKFEYEFIIAGEIYNPIIHYSISKDEKGCHLWVPV